MDPDISSIAVQFKVLISEICNEETVSNSSWCECLDRGVKMCEGLASELHLAPESTSHLKTIENASISLWNFSVTQKTQRVVSISLNAKNCGVAELADKVLLKTDKCITRLQRLFLETAAAADTTTEMSCRQKLDTEQDLFTLLCQRAETCVALSRPDDAYKHLSLAKELLPKFPKEGGFLSMLCYNIGVEIYQSKLSNKALLWLRDSYEIGKGKEAVGPKTQARTLRLLANVYLDVNPEKDLQNALNAVSLANREHCHPAGLFLKLKILILQNAADDIIKRASEDLIQLPELTVDLSLHTLELVNQHNRIQLVTWLIEELLKRFENSPDIGKLLITNLEVLIKADMLTEAKEFVEYCITAHHTGRPIEFSIKKRFHIVFWEQAAAAYENEKYEVALDWYNYSLSLYTQKTDAGDLNLAKLHRNRTNCYIALQQMDKACEAIESSVKCDPNCTHTHFILFKLAMLNNDSNKACECLKHLCEMAGANSSDGEDRGDKVTCGLIALAAQQALEHNKVEAASVALEHLSSNSQDTKQALFSLRCLIRLKLASVDKESTNRCEAFSIINYIKMGYNKLLKLLDTDKDQTVYVQNEANWFMKIAWNLALQCDYEPKRMKELYILCSQLLSLIPQDDAILSRQMTCQLMSAAACLHLARSETNETNKKPILEECLEVLTSCHQLHKKIQEQTLGSSDSRSKETAVLLLLYEFEARIHLKDPAVENVLEKALTLSSSDPKTFETLATIAIESPAHNKSVSVRVLKVTIRKHLQCQQPDINKCSKLFHSLIQLCLSGGSSQDLHGKDEAWNYYIEIFDIIDKTSQGQYPEMEIVWLMTKAWNCGINFYSVNKYSEAEKWCGMSMRMLKYLDTFKNSYQDHMSSVYGEVLAKVDSAGDRQSLEA